MTVYDLAQMLLDELGFSESPALKRSVAWPKELPSGVERVYFIQNTPVVYFSRLSEMDPVRLQELHKIVWNQSRTPLLYVVLPQEIRVYNCYEEPASEPDKLDRPGRLLQLLDQLTDVETTRQKIRDQLSPYDRLHLDTGAFWDSPDGQQIRRGKRADQRLLKAMDQLRRQLLKEGVPHELAYTLVGRSILVRYLEDQGILTSGAISSLTDGRANSYIDALSDWDTTYLLFENLTRRFNGDLLPVEEGERQNVQQRHLILLEDFLRGTDLVSRQQSFWPYDFRHIPIELISGIYDTFLKSDERRRTGTYYTPLALVDFVLDQTLPSEAIRPDMTVFDPACGSGVFLVRAYQRLVRAWQQGHGRSPTERDLSGILQKQVFGVDINPSAIRIAAFSLYLAMLDYLDKEIIQEASFHFPSMMGKNLLIGDFFGASVRERLGNTKFDRIIGNPPWGKGTLTPSAERRLRERNLEVGGRQLAQAFLLEAPEYCADDGEIALLAPAKSTILVTSRRHEGFRRQFFDRYNVKSVINFSALVYELFSDTLSPAVAIFYSPTPPDSKTRRIMYCVPKPSSLSRRLGAVVLHANEVKFLHREELLARPVLWKVALWGAPRDAALIERLRSLPTLREQVKKMGWEVHEGIQYGGSGRYTAPWLEGKPLVLTTKFRRYALSPKAFEIIERMVFHRSREPSAFRAPLALIRQSPTEGRCSAAFSGCDVVYRHKISGVAGQPGQEKLLKWLVAYINSPLAQYYHFLTSTSWAVERGTIIQEEYLNMPFPIPAEDDPRLDKAVGLIDSIVALLKESDRMAVSSKGADICRHEAAIAELVFDIFGLTRVERQLVHDLVDYGIDFFYWSKRKDRLPGGATAVQPPDIAMLRTYADTFVETATALLQYQGQTLNAVAYQDGAPLSVVGFELVGLDDAHGTEILESRSTLLKILRRLDRRLLEQRAPALYVRRHVRIYDDRWLYLVRPSERRFWTRSEARYDADSAAAKWLSHAQQCQE